ncbi:hypothetical protein [Kribbella sp. NPDC049584]|uniref:hypothetical protein n=1 Tax=Kribbella sp. NPDC049584 TaxID=3154833 RepID=UPI003424703A
MVLPIASVAVERTETMFPAAVGNIALPPTIGAWRQVDPASSEYSIGVPRFGS